MPHDQDYGRYYPINILPNGPNQYFGQHGHAQDSNAQLAAAINRLCDLLQLMTLPPGRGAGNI